MKRCKMCASCEFVLRWEAVYKDHEKNYPQNKDWIEQMREMDQSI